MTVKLIRVGITWLSVEPIDEVSVGHGPPQ